MFKKKFSEDEIRIKAHELWRAREGKGKTPDDDWNEAIESLKTERSLIKRFIDWTGFNKKTGWDFLQLLIVPAVLSFGAFYLQYEAKQRDDKAAFYRANQERKAADDKAKQDTLTKYFDQMADLLLKEKLLQTLRNPDSEIFVIGRSKTVTVLQSLDPNRQHLVIQFLKSADLNGEVKFSILDAFEFLYIKVFWKKGLLYKAQMSNTNLNGADLREANLDGANLREANLDGANLSQANLDGANLSQANLDGANLREADLRGANLFGADLRGADLSDANLSQAYFEFANFNKANLDGANLHNANLIGADLRGSGLLHANLRGADLKLAKLNIKQIESTCYWRDAKFSADFRKSLRKTKL